MLREELKDFLADKADDMKAEGIPAGATVRLKSETGEAVFTCQPGKIPAEIGRAHV